ncbi:carboxypeptidase-like regulatory domain-containing protein [Hymenobacter sp. BT175]|uniref:carboxypeptidase-like regulatory domain-containing protein n=1 Tax=Hymenobacter translucens TaxID=2886507 RepID=UPI001D0EDB33|nr:carboxypeptidase-like regulatory domain-containing protein [Hymenobacter translucens]MCC2545938.1 carboxypeptidase-like regulatory domain-containing protein [Hymenobacter translucens]
MRPVYALLSLVLVPVMVTAQPSSSSETVSAPPAASTAGLEKGTPGGIACPYFMGVVLDGHNVPVVGATVGVKGTKTLISTNGEGRYVIELPGTDSRPSTLQVSAGGYQSREIHLQDCQSLTISLEPLPGTRIKQRGRLKGQITRVGVDYASE